MKNQLLNEADNIMQERAKVYGDYRNNLQRAAAIASMINGKHFTSYDVATILMGLKFARIREQKNHQIQVGLLSLLLLVIRLFLGILFLQIMA